MAPLRFIDVIRKAEALHRDLSGFYRSRIAETQDEKLRVLLDHLSRHEASIEHCLKEFEHGASRAVLDSWFQISPKFRALPKIQQMRVGEDMIVEDLVQIGLDLDRFLISIYRELIGRAISTPLREALMDLLEMEHREEIRIMGAAAPD